MTVEELEAKGYIFKVRHHRHEIEVQIYNTGYGGSCWGTYRKDVMEAARQRASAHFMMNRLG
jgi:hypothetical protein